MKQKLILGVLALAAPAIVVGIFPSAVIAGQVLVFVGFAFLIVAALASVFRRYRLGPFELYRDPVTYLSTKFTQLELWLFGIGAAISFSGMLVIGMLFLRQ